MAAQRTIDPAWWDNEQVDGIAMRNVLADRDVKSVFTFLHRRGWSWGAIAQATDIGEQRVREIASGKRRIESYDVYVRVAVGLNIPRDYLGVGIRDLGEPAAACRANAAKDRRDTSASDKLRSIIGRATPADIAEQAGPDQERFESEVLRAWAERRHGDRRETSVTLVAGLAGSGKTEFAKFLSAVTGWALLDKDVITRPLVESMLIALGQDPNDRHSEVYRTEVRPLEYRSLLNATFANLDNGVSTVVTAPFLAEVADPQVLRWLLHRCHTAEAHLEIVWVQADVDTMRTYLQRRDAARDAWKLSHWDEYLASIDLNLRPQLPHFYIDNSLGSAVQLADEARRVSEWIDQ